MSQSKTISICCCFGTTFNTTQTVCEILRGILSDTFLHAGIQVTIESSKFPSKTCLEESEIVILATSVILDSFRGNVIRFARQNADLIKSKLSGLIIVNNPYQTRNEYIEAFCRQVGFPIDVSMSTGGLVNVVRCRPFLKHIYFEGLVDLKGDVYGEISQTDLTDFSKNIVSAYQAGHQSRRN